MENIQVFLQEKQIVFTILIKKLFNREKLSTKPQTNPKSPTLY